MKEIEIIVDDSISHLVEELLTGKLIEIESKGNGGTVRSISRQLSDLRADNLLIARDNQMHLTIMRLLFPPKKYKKKEHIWGGDKFIIRI